MLLFVRLIGSSIRLMYGLDLQIHKGRTQEERLERDSPGLFHQMILHLNPQKAQVGDHAFPFESPRGKT